MDANAATRSRFKGPEGRWTCHIDKAPATNTFIYQRQTRLTMASLQGGQEEGLWIMYNVAAAARVVALPNSGVATSYITCHAWAGAGAGAAKDGVDVLVGMADGQVVLLSLRAHLALSAAPGAEVKCTQAAATLSPEGVAENVRCVAVAWLHRADGSHLLAAFNTGNIYVYKKSVLTGEGGGKFSLSLGSSSKHHGPTQTIQLSGGGMHDAALSPDGAKLAAACADGALRLVDMASGTVIGGFQSYYGALLCAAWSPDGRYVATGGEDDLVALYGVAERYPVLHGEGHASWVSRVAFDPWALGGEAEPAPSSSSHAQGAGGLSLALAGGGSRLYRVVSAGQDGALCLWDLQVPQDGDFSAASLLATMTPIKRNASLGTVAALAGPGGGGPPDTPKHARKASLSKSPGAAGICPSLPRSAMYIIQPLACRKVSSEPLSEVMVAEGALYSADHLAGIKAWARPVAGGSAGASPRGTAASPTGLSTRLSNGLRLHASDMDTA